MRIRAVVVATVMVLAMPSARVAAAPGPSYAIDLSATSRQVGQTLTLTPVVTGVDPGTVVRCAMSIGRETALDNWMWMRVASDGCEPWTFPVPAAVPGDLVVDGYLLIGLVNGGPESVVHASSQVITVTTGGSEVVWSTNYPVQSWAIKDLVSTAYPALGASFTIYPSSAAERCDIRIVADFEESSVQPPDSCGPWTLTIPDREHQGPGNFFDPRRTEVTVRGWIGTSVYVSHTGTMLGQTFTANLPDFSPPAGGASAAYASNLPAIFLGPQRGHIGDATSTDTFLLDPVVAGTTAGMCQLGPSSFPPVVPGGCAEPALVGPPLGSSNAVGYAYIALIDDEVNVISDAYGSFGWVVPMGTLDLTAPSTADSGQSVSIDASTDAGVPAAWEITAEPGVAASGAVAPIAAAAVIASGDFDPSVASNGDQVHVMHAFAPGTWTISATFTDVRGDTRSNSTTITVADVDAPTGNVTINGGAAWTASTSVSLAVPATDAEGPVAMVAISNDGTNWTNRAYAPTQSWTLPSTNGTRTVYAKWQDAAGNWSTLASDTIGLDTVAPTATGPTNSFVLGSVVNSGRMPTRFAWSASDVTSGIARYEAALSTDGGAYATVGTSLTSAVITRNLAVGHTYRIRVRAVDKAGNAGPWTYGARFRLSKYQESSSRFTYVGTWYRPSSTSFWGGRERYARAAGAKAKFTFTGRSFAWVGCLGPTRGSARIYVNGVYVTTVSTFAATSSCRRTLYRAAWSTRVSRTIKIVVVGTAGHPRVDLDALVTGT